MTSFESVFPDEGECLSLAFHVTTGTPWLAPGKYQIREWFGDPEACVDNYVLFEPAQLQDPTARALLEALMVHFQDHRDTPDLIQSHYRPYWIKQDPTLTLGRPCFGNGTCRSTRLPTAAFGPVSILQRKKKTTRQGRKA